MHAPSWGFEIMGHDVINQVFESLVRRRGADTLIHTPQARWTADDVHRMAGEVALGLERDGAPPGCLIGLAAANGPGFFAGFLGLRRAGAVALLLDATTPALERQRTCRALGCWGQLQVRQPSSGGHGFADFGRLTGLDEADLALFEPDVAAVRLTSGTSGNPKGIVHTSETLLADDRNLATTMELRPDETILGSVPLSHAYGFGSVFLPAVVRGSRVVVPASGSPFAALEAAAAGGVTFMPTVPAYLQALLKTSDPPPLPPSVRLVITAGAPLHPDAATRLRRRWGQPVHVFYGASEVGGICFDREGGAGERGTVGCPVDGVRVDLVPTDGAEPGEGVVAISSPAAALGYFPDDDSSLAGGSFRTRDLGRLRDGELVLITRIDDLVNIRGRKVNPREVERVLDEMPQVDEAVVLAVLEGEGPGQRLAAVVASRSSQLTHEALRGWCARHLAPHKVPRLVTIVEEIPRTARGKLDRARLQSMASPGPSR